MSTQRIISFDVGIKNMAYCIFDVLSQDPNQKPKITIIDWNILNLSKSSTSTSTTTDPPTCMHEIPEKKGKKAGPPKTKPCGKKSKYNKDGFYVCEKHAKVSQKWMMPKKEYLEKSLQKQKIEPLNAFIKKENFYFFSSLPDKLKKQDLIDKVVQYFKTRCWEENPIPKKETSASQLDLVFIGRNLHEQLSQNPFVKTVTHVVIENQISPIANRMKTIQGMLAQIFIFHDIPVIEFVSSSNKLKDFVKAMDETNQEEEKKNGKDGGKGKGATKEKSSGVYKQHKSDAIVFCKQFLAQDFETNWTDYFQTHGKKDDLADSFLQGIWYINRKIITNAYNLKINSVTTS